MAHTLRLFEATQAHVFASSFSHTQGALTARVLSVCAGGVCVCVRENVCDFLELEATLLPSPLLHLPNSCTDTANSSAD